MTTPPLTSSAAGVVPPSLSRAFGGIWRLSIQRLFTLRHGLVLLGIVALLGVVAYAMLSGRNGAAGYLSWAIDTYFLFLVPVVAFINAGGALREDMKSSTVDYVFTRPVPRAAFVLFKYAAHVVAAQVEFLLAAGVLALFGAIGRAPDFLPALPMLLTSQFLLVLAFSAFGFLGAAITSRYVVIGIVYGAVVEIGVGQIPTQLSRLSMTHQVKLLLRPLVSSVSAADETTTLLAVAALLVGFAVVTLAASATLFHLREFGSAAES